MCQTGWSLQCPCALVCSCPGWGFRRSLITVAYLHPMYRAQSLNHQMLSLNKSFVQFLEGTSCENDNLNHSSQMCIYCKVHPLC